MAQTIKCSCGQEVNAGENFCGHCGKSLGDESVWSRGQDDFALRVSNDELVKATRYGFVVRHGLKALFFEDGKLVEIAESGRYQVKEEGIFKRLFGIGRSLSAVLVDAGDVRLNFNIANLKTRDGLFADFSLDVILRLEEPNSFFVNVMKDRPAYHLHELRSILFGEIKNALQEGIGSYNFDDINSNLQLKTRLASRMETHLRQTFSRNGFGFGQIQAFTITQKALDELAQKSAETSIKSRTIDVEVSDKDVDITRKAKLGDKDIEDKYLDVSLIEKRLGVYQKLKETDVGKIKTDEDFRKFKMEIDRDNALDDAEWKIFEDEILWKDEDRQRDRRFLTKKIELQQEYDEKRVELVNRKDLTLEEKKRENEILRIEQQGKLERQLELIEGMAKVETTKAQAKADTEAIEKISAKETEIQTKLKEIDLEKKKAEAKLDISKLEIEEKQLKSDLGLTNLERMKAIKRKDQHEIALQQMEMEQQRLEMRLKEDAERQRLELDKMRSQAQIEKDKMAAMADLGIEQLIAISGKDQAAVLGDLAQSQSLKGMTAEEIVAMKDPAALGKALEERAKSAQSEELKAAYEKMLVQSNMTADKLAEAHSASADRAERMHAESMRAMSGSSQAQVDQVERLSDKAMDRMGDVAATRARPGEGIGVGGAGGVQVCSNCKNPVAADRNFCQNCGAKTY